MKHLLFLVIASFISFSSQAQEFGVLAGIHNADADSDTTSFDATLGYRLGVVMKYEIGNAVAFRSGLTYTARHFELNGGTTNLDYELNYLDIPVLFNFQVNEMLSFYVGPVIAINTSGKLKGTSSGTPVDSEIQDVKSLYLLGQVGASFTFDQIGFDIYFERGLGDIWDNGTAKDFSIYGANFLFWF